MHLLVKGNQDSWNKLVRFQMKIEQEAHGLSRSPGYHVSTLLYIVI